MTRLRSRGDGKDTERDEDAAKLPGRKVLTTE